MTEAPTYWKRPERVEAMLWVGGAESASPIIDWMLENGGTARYHADGSEYADPNCPNKLYHETHHYCVSCGFTTQTEHIAINMGGGTRRVDPGCYIIRNSRGSFHFEDAATFLASHDDDKLVDESDLTRRKLRNMAIYEVDRAQKTEGGVGSAEALGHIAIAGVFASLADTAEDVRMVYATEAEVPGA